MSTPSSSSPTISASNAAEPNSSEAGSVPNASPAPEQDAFDKLVELITAEQQTSLVTLEKKVGYWDSESLWRDKVGILLPEILEEQQDNAIFPLIMRPLIEQSISESINTDPATLAETLMPSVQISVRRTVQNLFSDMVQQVNRSLDHALNIEWRLEAWRTGRPFAEVVLARTLEYKVEQVFLIDRESGLLLQQVAQDERVLEDGDMVSSMLAAINDFVRDSFQVDEQESLHNVSMGELTLVIEQGKYSYIAAVVRGHPHPHLDDILRSTQGIIEYRYKDVLKNYSGDSKDLEGSQEILAEALVEHYEAPAKKPKPATWLVFALVAALLLWGLSYQLYRGWQWRGLLQDLRVQEHILITNAQRGWRGLELEGLYYEDAEHPHPDTIIAASPHFKLEDFRVNTWRSYETPLHKQQQTLENWRIFAPQGVEIALLANRVQISNIRLPQDYAWLERIQQQLPNLPWLEGLSFENIQADVPALQAQLAQEYVFFSADTSHIYADSSSLQQQYAKMNAYIASLQLLQAQPLRLQIISQRGQQDSQGETSETLLSLLQQRGEKVAASLTFPLEVITLITIESEILPTGSLSYRGARAAPPPNTQKQGGRNQDNTASTVDNRAILGHVHIEVIP